MAITAEAYLRAAPEWLEVAQWMRREGRYAKAHYAAGLPVECLLRAYRVRRDKAFESRHDIKELAREARYYDFVRQDRAGAVQTHVAQVYRRWRNDHRYRSEVDLGAWLVENGVDPGIKGRDQRLRHSADEIVNAAIAIVQEGELSWTRTQA